MRELMACRCCCYYRECILNKVREYRNIRVMFVESICDNNELLEANYRRYVCASAIIMIILYPCWS